jgi:hypothetical protein
MLCFHSKSMVNYIIATVADAEKITIIKDTKWNTLKY